MGMADVHEALRLIAANADRGFFAGPRDSALISSAERALGGQLPPTYREFVKKLGAGNLGAFEIYGVINGDFDESSVPNGVWLTLNERRENNLPNDLIVIGSTGDGDYYCVKQSYDTDGPVIVYQTGLPAERQSYEEIAEDFGEFLLNGVRDEI